MPLRITLKANERLIINGACIKNGDRTADFLIETQCKFLRESEIIRESDADTPCKKLCVTLQMAYLSEDPSDAINLFVSQAMEVMAATPATAPYILKIQQEVEAGRFHHAIKRGKELVAYESSMLGLANRRTTAA